MFTVNSRLTGIKLYGAAPMKRYMHDFLFSAEMFLVFGKVMTIVVLICRGEKCYKIGFKNAVWKTLMMKQCKNGQTKI